MRLCLLVLCCLAAILPHAALAGPPTKLAKPPIKKPSLAERELLFKISADEPSNKVPRLHAKEIFPLRAGDVLNYDLGTIALGQSADGPVLYLLDGKALWTITTAGKLIHRTVIADPNFQPTSRAIVLPLPAPSHGAILLGRLSSKIVDQHATPNALWRIDAQGKVTFVAQLQGEATICAAALLPRGDGILLAGSGGRLGYACRIDLQGKTVWQQKYDSPDRSAVRGNYYHVMLSSIAPVDDSGAFIATGDYGEVAEFGFLDATCLVLRCDARGKLMKQDTFLGFSPTVRSMDGKLFALSTGIRELRGIDADLVEKWNTKIPYLRLPWMMPDLATISCGPGCVLAQPFGMDPKNRGIARYLVTQYDARGKLLATAVFSSDKERQPRARVVCDAQHAYVAVPAYSVDDAAPSDTAGKSRDRSPHYYGWLIYQVDLLTPAG